MSKVFVLDTEKQPLTPVHPGRARLLLKAGKAAVYRNSPFTIILKRQIEHPAPAPLRLKIDPGAKTTGLALVDDASGEVIWAAQLTHRGTDIKKALDTRRAVRRGRRCRQSRYRAPRFNNRRRKAGWIAPSLLSRVQNILTWVARISRIAHVSALSQELVRFDLQKMEQPDIADVEYQRGELFGYEVREYCLEQWGRACAYCGAVGVPLQLEHILARARGGTQRVSNLTLACGPCNLLKGTQDIGTFLAHDPARLSRILKQTKAPLKDASAVNITRRVLFERLGATGLPVEAGSGGLTKYNRARLRLPKTHWLDAAAVGASTPERLHTAVVVPLLIKACGRGIGVCATSMSWGSRSAIASVTNAILAFKREIWCGQSFPNTLHVGERMLGVLPCERGELSTLPQLTAKSAMCLTAFASSSDAVMAIATREENAMLPHPHPASKAEGYSSPVSKDRGSLAHFLWMMRAISINFQE